MIEKIRNIIGQWSVAQWCTKWVAWCFRWLCVIVQWFWERCTFNNFLISLIFAGGIFMLRLVWVLFWETSYIWWTFPGDNKEILSESPYDLLRALFISIGGVGAAIGLWFANQRQKILSKQVQAQIDQAQVQVDQSFNDRLGRGVNLLADEKNVNMRCAAFEILQDLMDNANDRQKLVIARIVYNFFRGKALIKRNEASQYSPRSKENTTQDLQYALDILMNLPMSVQEKLRPTLQKRLDFQNLDFSYLYFGCEKLEQIDFSKSHFGRVKFYVHKIVDVIFSNSHFTDFTAFTTYELESSAEEKYHNFIYEIGKIIVSKIYLMEGFGMRKEIIFDCVDIEGTKFHRARMENTRFHGARFVGVSFHDATFKKVEFDVVKFIDSDFTSVILEDMIFVSMKFVRGNFQCGNKIKMSHRLDAPQFIGTSIGYTEFDFADKTKPSDFFESCYFYNDWSSDKYNPMDRDREYELFEERLLVFISSDKPWSDQPAPQWVAVECAQWQLDEAKQVKWISKKDMSTLKKELKRAKKNLRAVQKEFGCPRKTPKPIPTSEIPPINET